MQEIFFTLYIISFLVASFAMWRKNEAIVEWLKTREKRINYSLIEFSKISTIETLSLFRNYFFISGITLIIFSYFINIFFGKNYSMIFTGVGFVLILFGISINAFFNQKRHFMDMLLTTFKNSKWIVYMCIGFLVIGIVTYLNNIDKFQNTTNESIVIFFLSILFLGLSVFIMALSVNIFIFLFVLSPSYLAYVFIQFVIYFSKFSLKLGKSTSINIFVMYFISYSIYRMYTGIFE